MGLASGNLAYETFWRQALRWVAVQAPTPVSVEVEPPPLGTAVPIAVRVVTPAFEPVSDASVQVRVEEPGGAARTLTASLDSSEPGLYRASLLTLAPGVHRIDVDASRGGQSLGRTSVQVLAGGVDPSSSTRGATMPFSVGSPMRPVAPCSTPALSTGSPIASARRRPRRPLGWWNATSGTMDGVS